MINIRILFFAKSRDLSGCSSTTLELDNEKEMNGNDLIELVVKHYPK